MNYEDLKANLNNIETQTSQHNSDVTTLFIDTVEKYLSDYKAGLIPRRELFAQVGRSVHQANELLK